MRRVLLWMILALLPLGATAQEAAPARATAAILTVTDAAGVRYRLTREDLAALPQTAFTTTTVWTEGAQEFQGVTLLTLLDHLSAPAGRLVLSAANGYRVERRMEELLPEAALLAYLRNGAPMSLRDKGPVWLIYDFDGDPKYRTEVIYANSIWQLDRIEITE